MISNSQFHKMEDSKGVDIKQKTNCFSDSSLISSDTRSNLPALSLIQTFF